MYSHSRLNDQIDKAIDDVLANDMYDIDEGESSGPCYETFQWCMNNTRRLGTSHGTSLCQDCWDLCREGIWPNRAAGRRCPRPRSRPKNNLSARRYMR
jgi:hypothetical protein